MGTKNKPSKPFKSYRQQLNLLKSRNLTISDGSKAITILKRNNYYNLINGYKDIFLSSKDPEVYYPGTTFEHINALSNFDKKIRHLFLYHILTFETLIKTKISYYHTKEYNEIFNYLDVNNFSAKAKDITKLISEISFEIQKQTSKDKGNNILHYIEKHGELPLWVLFQKAPFGTASYFFSYLQPDLKEIITNELNDEHNKRYKNKNSNFIESNFLENTIHFINLYRNICAHNERMFLTTFQKRGYVVDYSKYTTTQFRGTVFDLLILLKLFLLKSEYKSLVSEFKQHFEKLEKELSDNRPAFLKIKNSYLKMPNDWENILKVIWI